MASSSLCFTGFSREELAAVQALFDQAGAGWTLGSEAEAEVLVIDMDSLYGHMTWLKAHNSGKTTVGVTAGERSETDYLWRRPLDAASLRTLLAAVAAGEPAAASPPATDPVREDPVPESREPEAVAAEAATSPPPESPRVVAPPAPVMAPEPPPADASQEPPASRAADAYIAAYTTGQMAAMPAEVVPHQPRLSDFLGRGALPGPSRLSREGSPTLVFDPASQTWAGSATLKPLLPLLGQTLSASDFAPIDAAEFERAKAAAGGAHPYSRLLWLSGLAAGEGRLLPGHAAAKQFVLTKWPQIEREYPKHFRLATAMMKGPALVREIAELAGVPEADVVDFVNAGLASGVIVVEGAPAAPADVQRGVDLLARPRAG
jgi:hypothetical protein